MLASNIRGRSNAVDRVALIALADRLKAHEGPVDLLLGAGSRRARMLDVADGRKDWGELVTLDNAPQHEPDVLHDLTRDWLPFHDDTFDEIHAYEVLEHIGQQGDARLLLTQFADYWRVLKPGGYLLATVPHWESMWAWGDPSHTRVISPGTLAFLSQQEYINQIGKTPMSDFRHWYQADFNVLDAVEMGKQSFAFVLQAVKPSRWINP